MTLKGQLQHFSLGEIFQTLALNQHTGCLVLAREDEEVSIYFSSGCISLLSTGNSTRLGEVLVREGKISPQDLDHAISEQKISGKLLGRILIDQGHIHVDDVQDALRQRVQEELYELFLWEDGSFEFLPHQCPPELLDPLQRNGQIKIDPNGIVMEGLRQIDELGIIRQRIPDNRMLVRRVASDEMVAGQLSPKEERIWSLIEDLTSVSVLLEDSLETEFNGLKILHRFVEEGWIHPLDFQECLEQAREDRNAGNHELALQRFAYLYEFCEDLKNDPAFLAEYGKQLVAQKNRTYGRQILSQATVAYFQAGDEATAWDIGQKIYKLGERSLSLYRVLWALRARGNAKMMARVRDGLLEALTRHGEYLEAEDVFAAIEQDQSKSPNYWIERGENQRLLEENEQALTYFEHGVELLDDTRGLAEKIRVIRLMYDLDPSRSFLRHRIQELLAVQTALEERKRRRFTLIGASLIGLLLVAIYPLHYELKARELFQRARLLDAAHAATEDPASVIAAYTEVTEQYRFSTPVSGAQSRLETLVEHQADLLKRAEEEERAREERERARKREVENRIRKLFEDGKIAEANGDYAKARKCYEELLADYAPLVDSERILFPLEITSDPTGARVFIDGEPLGETPIVHRFRPGSEFRVRVERKGCTPQELGFKDSSRARVNLRIPMQRTPLAEATLPAALSGPSVVTPLTWVVSCRNGRVLAYDNQFLELKRRHARWGRKVGLEGHPAATITAFDEFVVLSAHTGLVEVVRREDGEKVWFHQGSAAPSTEPAVSADHRWVACADETGELRLHDMRDGRVAATFEGELPITGMIFKGDRLAFFDRGRHYYELSIPDLAVKQRAMLRTPGVSFTTAGNVLEATGAVRVPAEEAALPAPGTRIDRTENGFRYGAKNRKWVIADGDRITTGNLPVRPTCPPYPLRGQIFIGGTDGRFYCLDPQGGVMWSIPVNGRVWEVVPTQGDSLMVVLESGKALLVDGD